MGQVTIYLENHIESKMNAAAKSMKLSKSKWIARLIQAQINSEWPDSIKNLAGAWRDFPTAQQLRSCLGTDAKREDL